MVRTGRPPNNRKCSIADCGGKHFGRGWCEKHYLRWRSTGDPLQVKKVAKNVLDLAWIKSQCMITDDGCWEWNNAKDEHGYGLFSLNGKNIGVHRITLSLSLARELKPGMSVLHSCDNPPCCNPEHLREGTRRDNVADMDAKGRRVPPTSMTSHRRVLKPEQVKSIRREHARGDTTIASLARKYNVNWGTIKGIVTHQTWRNLS